MRHLPTKCFNRYKIETFRFHLEGTQDFMSTSYQNGRHADDTQREERGEETHGEGSLQRKTCETARSLGGEKEDRYIVAVFEEKAEEIDPIVLINVHTTQHAEYEILRRVPVDTIIFGFRYSKYPKGTGHRSFFEGIIPDDTTTLYISFYLKKHPK